MARFYFDIVANGHPVSADEEGMELPNLTAVQREIGRAVGEMARDELRETAESGQPLRLAVEVRTDNGLIMRARFSFELEHLQ